VLFRTSHKSKWSELMQYGTRIQNCSVSVTDRQTGCWLHFHVWSVCPLPVQQLGMGGSVILGIGIVEIPPAGELNGSSCLTKGNRLALRSNVLHYKAKLYFHRRWQTAATGGGALLMKFLCFCKCIIVVLSCHRWNACEMGQSEGCNVVWLYAAVSKLSYILRL